MYRMRERHWHKLCKQRKICALLLLVLIEEQEIKKNNRRWWIKPWIRRRQEQGFHHNLFTELILEDPQKFRRCLRMDSNTFEELLHLVAPLIVKQDTNLRKSIPPAERLSLTLRHLATGETQESLAMYFRLGQSTVSGIIIAVCEALVTVLRPKYLRFPSSEEEWRVVAQDYGERWNFHHCIGAMDGKHVCIDPPLKSGSLYYNYKGQYSVVLLALVDAQLRFIYVDVGTNGRISDSGVWNKCTLKLELENNSIHVPPAEPLYGTSDTFPYVIVADEGFPLTEKMLIPYPGPQCSGRRDRRIFNYRLSRARRCSENAFGVMGARFQIFRSSMRYDSNIATTIILTCCCVHNLLRSKVVGRLMYTPREMLDEEDELTGTIQIGLWREEPILSMVRLAHQGDNRHANLAIDLRNRWCEYFNSEVGAIPWQEKFVR